MSEMKFIYWERNFLKSSGESWLMGVFMKIFFFGGRLV